jgi:hypothetical protein
MHTTELAAHLSAISISYFIYIPRGTVGQLDIYFTVRSKSTPGDCVISREFIYIRCPTFHQLILNKFVYESTKSSYYKLR